MKKVEKNIKRLSVVVPTFVPFKELHPFVQNNVCKWLEQGMHTRCRDENMVYRGKVQREERYMSDTKSEFWTLWWHFDAEQKAEA